MANLTSKEIFLLEGEKYQQQLAIDKYSNYALQAEDPKLKTIFSNLAKSEEKHLSMINDILAGRIPTINNKDYHPYYSDSVTNSNDYLNVGNITLTAVNNDYNESDKVICLDALNTEELLHSIYSASSLEFEENSSRKVLSKIISDKNDSIQYLNNYMTRNGMYNNTILF